MQRFCRTFLKPTSFAEKSLLPKLHTNVISNNTRSYVRHFATCSSPGNKLQHNQHLQQAICAGTCVTNNSKRYFFSSASSMFSESGTASIRKGSSWTNIDGNNKLYESNSTKHDNNESSNFKNNDDESCDTLQNQKKSRRSCKPCPRSSLFVPGSKPKALQKIKTLNADAYVLDLEDSVGPADKRSARENIYNFITSVAETDNTNSNKDHSKVIIADNHVSNDGVVIVDKCCNSKKERLSAYRFIIRINSPDEDLNNALLDLELINELGPSCIEAVALPKVSTKTFDRIAEELHPELVSSLWALFETPQSILDAERICNSHHYRCVVMGYNDLAAELQLPSQATTTSSVSDSTPDYGMQQLSVISQLPLYHATLAVLFAARANNMYVLDGVYNDPTNAGGFARSLQICKALGCNGKTLIHPSQITPTNEMYIPTEQEVTWAYKIRDAVRKMHGGVAVVDGKMVEQLHVRQAAQTLMLHDLSVNDRVHSTVKHNTNNK